MSSFYDIKPQKKYAPSTDILKENQNRAGVHTLSVEPEFVTQKSFPSRNTSSSVSQSSPYGSGNEKSKKRILPVLGLFFGMGIIASSLLYGYIYFFGSYEVYLYPNKVVFPIEDTLFFSSGSNTSIGYDTMTLKVVKEKIVQSTDAEELARSAQGSIKIIYTGTVKKILKKDSILILPGDIKFRLKEAVVLEKKNGDTSFEIIAHIEAVFPGESSNIQDSKDGFQFPLDSTEKVPSIFGEYYGDITGGVLGKVYVVSGEVYTKTVAELESEARSELKEKLLAQVPEGFETFSDSFILTVSTKRTDGDIVYGVSPEVRVQKEFSGTILLFKKDDLVKKIHEDKNIPSYAQNISGVASLGFEYQNPQNAQIDTILETKKDITFHIKGETISTAVVPVSTIETQMPAFTKPESFMHYLNTIPEIQRYETKKTPSWLFYLPHKKGFTRIHIEK